MYDQSETSSSYGTSGPSGATAGSGAHEHIALTCSNCDACLVDVWKLKPQAVNPQTGEVFKWKLQASCPFCGDRSFIKEVEGVFFPGAFGTPKDDDENDSVMSTRIANQTFENDIVTFHVVKDNPNAKPVRNPS